MTGRVALEWVPRQGQSVEVLAVGRSGDAICGRTLGGGRCGAGGARVLVRSGLSCLRPVEGEVFTVGITSWSREGPIWTLDGGLGSPRFDPELLRLEPLALLPRLGETEGDLGAGRPPTFELERVVPRVPGFPLSGSAAISEIVAFYEGGDRDLAELITGELLARDLRCLEAHALLGRFYSEGPIEQRWTERALRHYRVGTAIGELSLEADFEGELPWWWSGNRAFLRCLGGYGRALERVGDAGSARAILERLLQLAPEDPMGVRNGLSAAAG